MNKPKCYTCGSKEGTYHDEPTVTWWTCAKCGDEWQVPDGER